MLSHRFSCYTLIPASPWRDLELARAWTLADPEHAGRVEPNFWVQSGLGCESWLLQDDDGPVYFFKAVYRGQDLEVHIQFPPYPIEAPIADQARHRRRMSLALIEGLRWLECTIQGINRIYFDSRSPSLIRFAEKHLGFVNHNGQLSKWLKTVEA